MGGASCLSHVSLIPQGPWLRDLPNASLVGSGDEILAWEGDGTSPQNCREEWKSSRAEPDPGSPGPQPASRLSLSMLTGLPTQRAGGGTHL